jgi:hypothetical protein
MCILELPICSNGAIQRPFLNNMLFMEITNIVQQVSYFVLKLIFSVEKFNASLIGMQDTLNKPNSKRTSYLYTTGVENLPDPDVMKYIKVIIIYFLITSREFKLHGDLHLEQLKI